VLIILHIVSLADEFRLKRNKKALKSARFMAGQDSILYLGHLPAISGLQCVAPTTVRCEPDEPKLLKTTFSDYELYLTVTQSP